MSSEPQSNERLFHVLMNTLQELWVLKDRQIVLERILDESGINVTEAVERLQPDAELATKLDAQRRQFIDTVLEPLQDNDGP
jgi:hypothetical protein